MSMGPPGDRICIYTEIQSMFGVGFLRLRLAHLSILE